ncbi:uncharacterized protein LOC130746712 isoform X2 [Lotus japonicus]|uniref:uncharacterized protein LOC130746712 isoform X2 n=1 Tax=Lotus japonicus TaxID=34305 RepID=UPI00258FD16B|nr:uncharacterized protein LOC130746712 isoform X2 [Lotus japonicus]
MTYARAILHSSSISMTYALFQNPAVDSAFQDVCLNSRSQSHLFILLYRFDDSLSLFASRIVLDLGDLIFPALSLSLILVHLPFDIQYVIWNKCGGHCCVGGRFKGVIDLQEVQILGSKCMFNAFSGEITDKKI